MYTIYLVLFQMYGYSRGQKRKYSSKGGNQGSVKRYKGSAVGSSGRVGSWGYNRGYFKGYKGPSQVIIRQPSSVPDRVFLKVRLGLVVRLTSASGPIVSQVGIKANSLNDPQGSSGTAEPLGLQSAWENLYNNYTVLGCKLKIIAAQESAGTLTNTSSTLTVFPATSPTTAVGNDRTMGERYAKFDVMSTSLNKARINNYVTTAQYYGVDKQTVLSESSYTGVLGSGDPSALWYFIISFQGTHPTEATTCSLVVQITQYACLWRPLNQA